MSILAGVAAGFIAWFLVRYLVAGLYTVNQNERAVKTSFGRAHRIGQVTTLDDPISEPLQVRAVLRSSNRKLSSLPRRTRPTSVFA